MPRRSFQLVAGIVLILAALTPLMECFDRWDKNPGPANDTEMHLTAWFVGTGVVLTLAKLLRFAPRLTAVAIPRVPFISARRPSPLAGNAPQPTVSPPPLSLRI